MGLGGVTSEMGWGKGIRLGREMENGGLGVKAETY